ncbi:ankyrin, partial [Neocallimastix californiae]
MKNGVDINIRNENSYLINESLKYHNDILAKVIIEKGANINIKDNFRKTPLMYAIENNNSSDIIELLLQKGANINDKDFNGNTPLHYACKFSNVNIVSLIMGKKPKINEQNEKGETPLIISFMERNWICAKRLLEYNDINVTIKDKNGNTILNYFKDLENDSYKFNEEIISFIK